MNVSAYLDRIGHSGPTDSSAETLRALHRVHMLAVPFENLDIQLRRAIVCDEARFLHKIIEERRGGFCYELNGAFAALLRELGFQVTLLSARVAHADGGDGPEFDHLTLRVDLPEKFVDDPQSSGLNQSRRSSDRRKVPAAAGQASTIISTWLADVGFGDSFLEPLHLESDIEQAQFGRIYRLKEVNGVFAMEVKSGDEWKRQYSFTLRPREIPEFIPMCHYQQTSPESHFTRQRVCSRATPQGRVTLSDLKLIETRDGKREERELAGEEEWHAALRDLFGIVLPTHAAT